MTWRIVVGSPRRFAHRDDRIFEVGVADQALPHRSPDR
jgi:hypothetical protein